MLGLFLIAMPLKNAFAYEGGLLEGKMFTGDATDLINITDNDTYSSARLSIRLGNNVPTLITYEFEDPVDLIKYYSNHYNSQYTLTFYDSNSNVLYETIIPTAAGPILVDVDLKGVKKITLGNNTQNYVILREFDVYGDTSNIIKHNEIESFDLSSSDNEVHLKWSLLDKENVTNFKLYRDGSLIKTFDKDIETYKDVVGYGETHEYKITAVYIDSFESEGLKKTISTAEPKPVEDVKEIKVETDYDRVDLSWILPSTDKLKHVNIYREKIEEVEEEISWIKNIFGTKVMAAESKKIFETNGTYFNDLTVEPSTTYEYTLTTTSVSNMESEGVMVQAITKEEPPPVLKDISIEEQENGDYLFSWQEPTKGKVRIIVGGIEYATVNAADKQIIIPKQDMKYTPMNDPDVRAIPISESGKEGEITSPPSSLNDMELPFGVKDLLMSGSDLLWWIAPFVLLGLSFLLVPKLRNLIVNAVKGKREKRTDETGRRTKADLPETEKRERVEKEPKEIKKEPIEKQGKKLRSVKVRERQIKEPKEKRERTVKEPKVSRGSRESRQPRQAANRTREAREGRQSERVQRMPREPRRGR